MADLILADVRGAGPIGILVEGVVLLFPYAIALALETVMLTVIGWESPNESLGDAVVSSLWSTAAVLLLYTTYAMLEDGWFWIAAWLLSTLVEALVLRWRRQTTLARAGTASLLMNTASYIWLFWYL